jgi:hypothetical protein
MIAMQRRRLEKLEARLLPREPKPGLRVILAAIAKPLSLATSECVRWLCPDGTLTEFVRFDGDCKDMSDVELERFIGGFPINSPTGSYR